MIIFVDLSTGSWSDDPRCSDILPGAVAVKKESCQFLDSGLVNIDGFSAVILDTDPFGLTLEKDENKEVIDMTTKENLPPVLEPTNAAPATTVETGGVMAFDGVTYAPAKRRGRPMGATTKPFPEPWASRAKVAGGQTKLANYLGIAYKVLREIVDGKRQITADVQAKAEFLDKQGADAPPKAGA